MQSACRTSAASPTSTGPAGRWSTSVSWRNWRSTGPVTPEALHAAGLVRGLEFPGQDPRQRRTDAQARHPGPRLLGGGQGADRGAGGSVEVLERTDRWTGARPRSRRLPLNARAQAAARRQGRRAEPAGSAGAPGRSAGGLSHVAGRLQRLPDSRICGGRSCSRSAMLVIFRFIDSIPVPGVDREALREVHREQPAARHAQPLLRRRLAVISRSPRSGSTPTSPPRSSCS